MPASKQKASEPKKLQGIFISYRRTDNPDAVGRIYDRLIAEFGKARVFKDVDSIPLGQDFRGHLNDIVGGCAAVLAIIGPRWTDIRTEAGQKRLDDPDDFVRIELEAALARSVPVVPVLVGHAPMPGTSQLPLTLSSLAFRQSIEVRPDPDFHNDATRLVAALRAIIDPNAPPVQPLPEKPKRSWLPWLASLAAATTLAAIAFAIPALKHLRESPPLETRVDIVTPATDQPTNFALSPDGRQIVFVASADGVSRLWLRSLATTTAQPLPGTEGATDLFWSPDGRSIGYFAGGELKRLDLDLGGGASLTLARATAGRGGTWSAEGVILFAPNISGPIFRMAASGGAAVAVTTIGPQQAGHRYPHFLPDGQRFLFYVRGAGDTTGLYLGALDGSAPTRLTPADSSGVYVSGWMLWVLEGALIAQKLDLAKATLTGEPVTLADGVMVDDVRLHGGALSVSPTGLVAYRAGGNGLRSLIWFDRSGTARGAAGDPDGSWSSPRVSNDGRLVAASRTVQGNSDVWLLDGDRTSRFTFDPASDQLPVWSPDGSRIVFRSFRLGGGSLYEKLTNGTGAEERLAASDQSNAPSSWSADGRFLLYTNLDPQSSGDLWVLPMVGDRTPSVLLKTAFRESASALSPDGRWVAYLSNESGRAEVYVRPFVPPGATNLGPPGGGAQQVSTAGGIYPAWAPDGKEIYYLNPEADMMAAPIRVTGSVLEPGAPVKLFATRILGGGVDGSQGRQYDVAPDGRFLITTVGDSTALPITLIQNWNPDAGK
jgi:Tol biopolymer transport system component